MPDTSFKTVEYIKCIITDSPLLRGQQILCMLLHCLILYDSPRDVQGLIMNLCFYKTRAQAFYEKEAFDTIASL